MKQRLKSALALLEDDTIEQLVDHFLLVSQNPRFDALLVFLLNIHENRLECCNLPEPDEISSRRLYVDIDDVNNPLIQVMRKGTPTVWDSLNHGARIDDPHFRTFIAELPHNCGLYGIPLFDCNGQACGVVAIFAENVSHFTNNENMFGIYCHVMQHRLKKLQELEQLRGQLRQIRQVFQVQRQKEKQLDELLASLSESKNAGAGSISVDYSHIDNLPKAIEEFESAVLVQRQRQFGNDTRLIAQSLGIAQRTLVYKLAKYGCRL
ncbi:type VI secretion system sigma-54 dependent transcriptional regulator [Xenorhabdus stockiae]|uniref:Type VI secretion system sigma-54 dependent transcriptional regulator n=1 Tax=Xenorhabdus stockiae TaxID=351614 RepID=A0A2D0KNH9_9GAMM|nr:MULTISPECIES: Fis family transcriptional regulator [Xenorhabdus]PHM64972.1 type VI secretion system sigma-54 dependent transcriptional regulator [Xenorhabdus stockiae]PHM70762.1 type VI secretion system sigma-54 dependent transcriptional regulator [Xenorhabdus sp. KJ12.1]